MIESFNKKNLEEKIDQYINGQLSAKEVDDLWAELIQDGYHLDYLKSAANLKAVIEKRREKQKAGANRKYWYYAAAAVVTLLIAVMGVLNFYASNSTSVVKPVASVELDYYRSGDGALASKETSGVIRDAIRLANTGRVNEAISLLNNELKSASKPDFVAKLSLNLGSLHYNQGNYNQAIKFYNNVIANKNHIDVLMLEKAYWYTGNAYFHLDNLSKAQSNIRKAYDLNGAYRRVAESYLKALSEE